MWPIAGTIFGWQGHLSFPFPVDRFPRLSRPQVQKRWRQRGEEQENRQAAGWEAQRISQAVEKAALDQVAQWVWEDERGQAGRPEEGHQAWPQGYEGGAPCTVGKKIDSRWQRSGEKVALCHCKPPKKPQASNKRQFCKYIVLVSYGIKDTCKYLNCSEIDQWVKLSAY